MRELEIGRITYRENGHERTAGPAKVWLEDNRRLFASRLDLVVYDPGLLEFRVIRGEPAWRPHAPDNETCLPIGLFLVPSLWRRAVRACMRWAIRWQVFPLLIATAVVALLLLVSLPRVVEWVTTVAAIALVFASMWADSPRR